MRQSICSSHLFFFFNSTAPTEIYTLSLHDALPISTGTPSAKVLPDLTARAPRTTSGGVKKLIEPSSTSFPHRPRSEEHTSELQSHSDLVCRLLLEKKKKK